MIDKARDPFLKEFMMIQTDLLNLKAFIRIRKVFRKEQFLNYAIIQKGYIAAEDYRMLFEADEQFFNSYLKKTRYARIFEREILKKIATII